MCENKLSCLHNHACGALGARWGCDGPSSSHAGHKVKTKQSQTQSNPVLAAGGPAADVCTASPSFLSVLPAVARTMRQIHREKTLLKILASLHFDPSSGVTESYPKPRWLFLIYLFKGYKLPLKKILSLFMKESMTVWMPNSYSLPHTVKGPISPWLM